MFLMRYFYKPPKVYIPVCGEIYICNHPVYNRCTLYKRSDLGLAVIQQRYDALTKHTYWTEIDEWLVNDIYLAGGFDEYFMKYATESENGLYFTVTVRQIMWALRMKPLPKERWETVFDRKGI